MAISVVHFFDVDFITEEYLFCKKLPEQTTGQKTFQVTNEFFIAQTEFL